jgi:hypothetical protein
MDTVEQEISLFREKIAAGFPQDSPLAEEFGRFVKQAESQAGMAAIVSLSVIGLPAWFSLYVAWIYWRQKLVEDMRSPYAKPARWRKLAADMDNVAKELDSAPVLSDYYPGEQIARNRLIGLLRQRTAEVRKTTLVNDDFYVSLDINVEGILSASSNQKKRIGKGNKSKPIERDPKSWLWVLGYWVKQKSEGSHRKELVEIGKVFFDLTPSSGVEHLDGKFRTLMDNENVGEEGEELNKLALKTAQLAEEVFGKRLIPSQESN